MNYQSMRDPAILIVALREQTAALNRLAEVLGAPTTRTATLQLPSGPATMTVRESRAGRADLPLARAPAAAGVPPGGSLAKFIAQLEAAGERGRAREARERAAAQQATSEGAKT